MHVPSLEFIFQLLDDFLAGDAVLAKQPLYPTLDGLIDPEFAALMDVSGNETKGFDQQPGFWFQ